ncbi:DUF488 family protein [Borborobacter arsenicus]
MPGFTTIGHSNRSLDEFLNMLRDARVTLVVDVRSFPKSRTNPVFNTDRLPGSLEQIQVGYRHIEALGGRRPKQSTVDGTLNSFWKVQSFHNYADYALGEAFSAALAEIICLGRRHRPALMCAEAVWWRCHRRIITDYLLLNGYEVEHLMSPGHSEHAVPTPAAVRTSDGKVIYPSENIIPSGQAAGV